MLTALSLTVAPLFGGLAHFGGSPLSASAVSACVGSKHFHLARALSLLVNALTFTGQSPGSAILPRDDGTSFHASIIACTVAASSVYDASLGNCSSMLSCATSVAPPETGGVLE